MSFDPGFEDNQVEGEGFGGTGGHETTGGSEEIGTDEATLQWLRKNKLSHLIDAFKQFGATLEILTILEDSEIKQFAKETLHLNIIDTAKLVKAVKKLKENDGGSSFDSQTPNNQANSSKSENDMNDGNGNGNGNEMNFIFLGQKEQQYMEYIQKQLSIVQQKHEILETLSHKWDKQLNNSNHASNENDEKENGSIVSGIDRIAQSYDTLIKSINDHKMQVCNHYQTLLNEKRNELNQLLPKLNEMKNVIDQTDKKFANLMIQRNLSKQDKQMKAQLLYQSVMDLTNELNVNNIKSIKQMENEFMLESEFEQISLFVNRMETSLKKFWDKNILARKSNDKMIGTIMYLNKNQQQWHGDNNNKNDRTCGNGHVLKCATLNELTQEDKGYRMGFICDICSLTFGENKNEMNNEIVISWHCTDCQYDCCNDCFDLNLKPLKFSKIYKHDDIKIIKDGNMALRPDISQKCGMAAIDHNVGFSKGIYCWRFHISRIANELNNNVTAMVGVSYPNIKYKERTDRPQHVYGIDSIGFFQFDGYGAPIKLNWRDGHNKAIIDLRLNLQLNTMEFIIVKGNSHKIVTKENQYFKAAILQNKSWVPCVMFYDKNQSATISSMDEDAFERLHSKLITSNN